jgi:putative ABC transport system permease protein
VRPPFWLKLALRESRSSARRLGVYMGAITLGVAALVAINSFRAQVVASVDAESRALLGADLRLDGNREFPDSVVAVLDSAAAAGVPVSRVTTTLSIVLSDAGAVQLAQVRAVDDGGYPFYGAMVTDPPGLWPRLRDGRSALLELSLLQQLGVAAGDSVRVGALWFEVRGALTELPPEMGFRNAIGPRIYIHADQLAATGLVRFASLVTYEAYLQIRDADDMQRFIDRNHDTFRRAGIGVDTSTEQAENLANALEALTRFLGLVGLSALLLGGLGVASAVNVFVKDKRRTIAVLRCLGATQRTAFSAYMLQATVLGTTGALLGAMLGVGIQALLPGVMRDVLPITVPFAIHWPVVAAGVGIGALVAAVFSLLPLLAVRGISPLQALRYDVDDSTHRGRRFDIWRIAAAVLIVASVLLVAVWQARLWRVGLAYAAALTVGMAVLWLCARLLILGTRRLARGRAFAGARTGSARRRAFALRTGIANLYRPRNQTTAVTMSLGFGVFLVATLWVVQQNLLSWMRTDASRPQPSLVFFDIQTDQIDEVRQLLVQHADAPPDIVPIVPARVAAVGGRSVEELLGERPRRVEPWALRREYRHTYRDTLTGTERMVDGEWFDASGADDRSTPSNALADARRQVVRVSAEQDVARNLGIGLGDTITWNVSGVEVESVVTSMRSVDWARFETNFFFVFEPGALDVAPQTAVSLVAINDDSARAALQRTVVQAYPNITVVDIGSVQRILQRIVDRIIYAIRFMAAFSVGAGALVLSGAIAASRFQRVRESALLRALGATRAQVRNVMLVEYAALGALAALTGVLLAAIAGWLLMRFAFRMPYTLPAVELAGIWVVVTLAAAALGMLNSREALRSTPLAALREAES